MSCGQNINNATVLRCMACDAVYTPEKTRMICDCGQPLEQQYDFDRLKERGRLPVRPDAPGIWRYADLLPVADRTYRGYLGEGLTPLVQVGSISAELGVQLHVKDEGQNPTGTFKARGASVGVARLKELGWTSLAMPTVGSGGSAWAAYCARLGVDLHVGLPDLAGLPDIGFVEPRWYGAAVTQYAGQVAPAFHRMRSELAPERLYVGAFQEPYRLEGDKTLLFEIYEQLNDQLPDYLFWPTGGAVGLVGIAKGVEELRRLDPALASHEITLIAAQHSSGAPLADALRDGTAFRASADPGGIAPGVWVGDPFAGDYILTRVRQVLRPGGASAADRDIRQAMSQLARRDGVLLSPEGSLTIACAQAMIRDGKVAANSVIVCVNTASPLRYPHLLAEARPPDGQADRSPSTPGATGRRVDW